MGLTYDLFTKLNDNISCWYAFCKYRHHYFTRLLVEFMSVNNQLIRSYISENNSVQKHNACINTNNNLDIGVSLMYQQF